MVKARSASSCSERPCLPLASLKHSRPAPPLRRPPPAMESPPPSPPRRTATFAHFSAEADSHHGSLEFGAEADSHHGSLEFGADAEIDAATAPSWQSAADDSDDSSEQSQEEGFTCGRQRLQHHRTQMSGNVVIPETWGREQQLQEWVRHGIVEDALRPAGLMIARTALVGECQRRGRKPARMPAQAAVSADVEVS